MTTRAPPKPPRARALRVALVGAAIVLFALAARPATSPGRLAQRYLAEHTDFLGPARWDGEVESLDATLRVPEREAVSRLAAQLRETEAVTRALVRETYAPHRHLWRVGLGALAALALGCAAWMRRGALGTHRSSERRA